MQIDIDGLIREREAQLNQLLGELNLLRLMRSSQVILQTVEPTPFTPEPDPPTSTPPPQYDMYSINT